MLFSTLSCLFLVAAIPTITAIGMWPLYSPSDHVNAMLMRQIDPSGANIQVGKSEEMERLDAFYSGQWLSNPKPILSYDEDDALTINMFDGAEITVAPLIMGYYDIIVDDKSLYHCYYTGEAKGVLINIIADRTGVRIAPSPDSTCLPRSKRRTPHR